MRYKFTGIEIDQQPDGSGVVTVHLEGMPPVVLHCAAHVLADVCFQASRIVFPGMDVEKAYADIRSRDHARRQRRYRAEKVDAA